MLTSHLMFLWMVTRTHLLQYGVIDRGWKKNWKGEQDRPTESCNYLPSSSRILPLRALPVPPLLSQDPPTDGFLVSTSPSLPGSSPWELPLPPLLSHSKMTSYLFMVVCRTLLQTENSQTIWYSLCHVSYKNALSLYSCLQIATILLMESNISSFICWMWFILLTREII